MLIALRVEDKMEIRPSQISKRMKGQPWTTTETSAMTHTSGHGDRIPHPISFHCGQTVLITGIFFASGPSSRIGFLPCLGPPDWRLNPGRRRIMISPNGAGTVRLVTG